MTIHRTLTALVIIILVATPWIATAGSAPTNYFYETSAIINHKDSIGDDKGPGYYQYPLDKRLRRGTFDLKSFSVYEEGNVYTFVIQMRSYIMTEWPDKRQSNEQGFVAQMFDIYIDLDGRPGSGYQEALPGRDLEFAGRMGWEKVIMVTPISQFKLYEILKHKTDDLGFQNRISDIVIPDYINVQRDKFIIRISKDLIGEINPASGFQCMVMGFSNVVSVNRLLNRNVRSFATRDDFGGGEDTYGDSPVIDMIVPEGKDQYAILRDYHSDPFRANILYASVPFVYPESPDPRSQYRRQQALTPALGNQPSEGKPKPWVKAPGQTNVKPPTRTVTKTTSSTLSGFKPIPKSKENNLPEGFLPITKTSLRPKSEIPRPIGMTPIRKAIFQTNGD